MNEDEVKQETPVENEEVNEDEFLDEHPVEPIVAEEPKPEATEEEKPVEEPKEEEPPRRPVLKSYEYEDKRLEDIENARIIWNKGYRKMSLIKMIVAVVVLTLIIVGWIVPTLTMPNAGPVPLYIALGIAAAGILAIVGFGFIQKKKDREGVAAYFTAYYNALNGYVFDGLDIEVNGNYENKVDDAEVEASGLYPGFAQVGSREAITFTYKNMDCAIADMAVQNVIGDAFRGATWVSIHNGGGVGWGEVINGGFGMVIDGSDDSARHIREMLFWDVNNGIARRSWARNEGARMAIEREMAHTPGLKVTLPNLADESLIRKTLENA